MKNACSVEENIQMTTNFAMFVEEGERDRLVPVGSRRRKSEDKEILNIKTSPQGIF